MSKDIFLHWPGKNIKVRTENVKDHIRRYKPITIQCDWEKTEEKVFQTREFWKASTDNKENTSPPVKLNLCKHTNQFSPFKTAIDHKITGNQNKQIDSQFSKHPKSFYDQFVAAEPGCKIKLTFLCAVKDKNQQNTDDSQ